MKAKILYVMSRMPYPNSGGRERMIHQTLRMLKGSSYDIDVYYFSKIKDNNLEQRLIKEYGILNISHIPISNYLLAMFKSVLSSEPFQFSFYKSSAAKTLIDKSFNNNYKAIIFDMLKTTSAVSEKTLKLGNGLVLEMDDLLSLRYERMREAKVESFLGQFDDHINSKFIKMLLSKLSAFILSIESKRMAKYEARALKYFDIVTLTSPKEADRLKLLGEAEVIPVPPSVNGLGTVSCNGKYKSNDLVFVGNLLMEQNLASLSYIIHKILPTMPEVKLKVIGKYDRRVVNLVDSSKHKNNILLLGFVSSLEEHILFGDVLLSPILFGSGVKTKIVDALEIGVPILTNELGIEGLDLVSHENVFLCDSYKDYAKFYSLLMNSSDTYAKIVESAWKYAEANLNESMLMKRYLSEIENI
ncbi:glycosyltransferase [Pseudoalteromonas sp. CnMc7-37]|uniref:glycosyltransferase n=1 Tax=Pseudoalteromonas sp. CnMc7-37 TaxID=2954496 RepID=UPI0020970D58|nr:glycosyltransferase [Pseudoalteromonas sp. CnMc7-37]MCO7208279.1 glycosyltransferase [Pseudoalteromonas sp. CnMc7-37]